MNTQHLHIAIDGPSGAGKSTVARAIAQSLGIMHLDTGAMYRAVGLKALRRGIDPKQEQAVCQLLPGTALSMDTQGGLLRVWLDGDDVTQAIREHAVSAAASDVSRYAPVRTWLVTQQQAIAGENDLVMDGRDIGTNVLPCAPHKFFVTASAMQRARRRALELSQAGQAVDIAAITLDIEQRDHQDSTRALNPLRPADDAVIIDTSDMNIPEVVQSILAHIKADT